MPRLAEAIAILKAVFVQYAGKDGDDSSLTKKELCELLRIEFGNTDNDAAESFFKMLDSDRSGTVDFKEFVMFVTTLCLMS